jgi:hypothetical protein
VVRSSAASDVYKRQGQDVGKVYTTPNRGVTWKLCVTLPA